MASYLKTIPKNIETTAIAPKPENPATISEFFTLPPVDFIILL